MIINSETECSTCSHTQVCKYTREVENVNKKVTLISYSRPIRVIVTCEEYRRDGGTLRGNN